MAVPMPDKETGKHRWVAMATYTLTESQCVAAHTGAQVNLDGTNRLSVAVGCWDCECEYTEASGTSCEGDPVEFNQTKLVED